MPEEESAPAGPALSPRRRRVSLFFLYAATLVMRAAAFMTIAVITSDKYLQTGVDYFTVGVLVAFYPIAELITVMYFGVLSDKIGRKPVLLFAHGVSALAVFCFALTNYLYLLFAFAALYGVALAAKTSSTLTMVADLAGPKNRAQLMAAFDIVTFLGLAGGYVSGFTLLNFYGFSPTDLFYLQAVAILISVAMVWLFVHETRTGQPVMMNGWDAIKSVFARKEVRRLLPVYAPVISIYGMVISFLEKIVEEEGVLENPGLRTIIVLLGLTLVGSMIANAWLSDKVKKRKPFMILGLIFFGVLSGLLGLYLHDLQGLVAIWPVVVLVCIGAGAFPPAVLAYLADITKKETSGTAFGIYSLVLGFGFAFGPLIGGVVLDAYNVQGFLILIGAFLAVAVIGVARLKESLS